MRRLALPAIPALVIGLGVGLPENAHAATGKAANICAVTEHVTYSPPMTNATRSITVAVTGRLDCAGRAATTAGFAGTHVQPELSCNLTGSGSGAIAFRWTDTAVEPSVFTHTSVAVVSGGAFHLALSGSITAGAFAPARAEEVVAAPGDPAACAAGGISRQEFTGVLVIGR